MVIDPNERTNQSFIYLYLQIQHHRYNTAMFVFFTFIHMQFPYNDMKYIT